jgi:signal transduction histidine kinase/ligand-binding sensor domain-containing protein
MRLFVLLSVSLLIPVAVFSQIRQEESLRFERFTIDQGLTADRVYSITQDNPGYIWLATDGGVSRYDGYGFAAYRNIPGDPSSLTDNFTHVVYADSRGDVWVGTRYGLNRYIAASDNFERFYHTPGDPNSLPHSSVHSIYESASGRLWMGTENGLAEFDRETGHFISEWVVNGVSVSLRGSMVTTIAGDEDGRLWIGTNNRGLVAYQPSDNTLRFMNEDASIRIPFPSVNISRIMVDSNGDLWIGFLQDSGFRASLEVLLQYGLARFNPRTMEFKLYSHDPENGIDVWHRISDIIEDSDNTIWVTSYLGNTYTGLHRFNRDTETFTRYSHEPYNQTSLSWSYSLSVFEDRYRNLWVGTSRGLNKADLGRWQMGFMNVDPSEPFNLINNFYGIEEIEDDLFWLGLDGFGVIKWNRGNYTHEQVPNDDPMVLSGSIHVIRKDLNGYIWLGNSGQGLIRHDPATGTNEYYQYTENEAGSIAGNYITDIRIARDSTVWVATSNGLSRYNRHNNTFTNFRQETHSAWMTGNALSSILEDRHGNIWIGTNRHVYDPAARNATGLIKWNPVTNQYRTFRHDASTPGTLSNDAIYSIAEAPDGDIWVATNNGLNRYLVSEDRFDVYLESNGLPSPVIIGILFDDDGFLWLSTLNGLARLDPENGAIRVFNKADNVQGNRFNDNSFFKSSTGLLLFGGVAGLNYFDPSMITGSDVIPEMLITGITVNDEIARFEKPLDETDSITLGWTENSVGFEFTAVNFRSAGLTQYEYMLQGFDSDWIRAGTRRYTNYTNLNPGTYRFLTRARNADGIRSINDAAIGLVIRPPWWRSWGAYGIYALLFAGMIYLTDRYQRKRLLRKERENAREKELEQAKEIEKAYNDLEQAHQNLEQAHQNLEAAHSNLKAAQDQLVQQEKLASLGQLTAGIAHEIKNPLNFVNNFSDVSLEMIDEALEELQQIGENKHAAETAAILADIRSNLTKIHEHGFRADGIVKSMLMHSRGGTGTMEPTDLNELVKEYVNLTYHGMRAGKEAMNADIQMDLDDSIVDVPLVAGDFSRVILNLCNNAFDAMKETREIRPPKLTVRTKKSGGSVTIEIEDNGPGIPDEIKDKILQPFFTTKKGTQGTGLGLSITNDIIKANGGTLGIRSRPGQTVFTIIIGLPDI